MAGSGYLATIARRAQATPGVAGAAGVAGDVRSPGAPGAAATLVPPSIPMRGWEGAWPSELPAAEVIGPASAESVAVEGIAEPVGAMGLPLVSSAARDAAVDPGLRPLPRMRARSWLEMSSHGAPEGALDGAPGASSGVAGGSPASAQGLASGALVEHDAPSRGAGGTSHRQGPQVALPEAGAPNPPRAAVAASAPPTPARGSRGLAAPLRAVPHSTSGVAPAAGERAGRSPAAAPAGRVAVSPAEALHAAFQWVTGGPPARAPAPAAPAADAPGAPVPRGPGPSASIGGRASLAPAPLADRTPAGASGPASARPASRALHIGSIEVEIQPPPAAPLRPDAVPGASPASAAPGAPLARGFTTPLGLRQA
ncbi:MAG TPA: hypothetical protein VFK02_26440 [Kofleriaceae bacterium]|nr:hypothetical protein [Kofleriaceae bacterium]